MIKVSDMADYTDQTEPFEGACFLKRPPKKLMNKMEYLDYLNNIMVDPFDTDEVDKKKRHSLQWLFHQKGLYEGNGYIEGDKSPVRLVEAVITCKSLNIYPPLWVLDELTAILKKYFKGAAKGEDVKINDYFGLKKTLFKERIVNTVKWPLMQDICYLNHFWGISIEKSCEFVADKLRETKINNNTSFEFKNDIESETIFKWYKQLKVNIYLNNFQVRGPHVISEEEAKDFLQQFPIETRSRITSEAKRSPTEQT